MVNWGVFFSGEHFPTKAFFALFKPRRVSWKRLSNIIFTTPFRWRQFTFFCVFLPPSLAAKKKLKAMIKQRKENESPASFLVRMGEKNRTICEKLPAVSSFCKKTTSGRNCTKEFASILRVGVFLALESCWAWNNQILAVFDAQNDSMMAAKDLLVVVPLGVLLSCPHNPAGQLRDKENPGERDQL